MWGEGEGLVVVNIIRVRGGRMARVDLGEAEGAVNGGRLPYPAHSGGTGVRGLSAIGRLVRYWYGDWHAQKMCELCKKSWGILCGDY